MAPRGAFQRDSNGRRKRRAHPIEAHAAIVAGGSFSASTEARRSDGHGLNANRARCSQSQASRRPWHAADRPPRPRGRQWLPELPLRRSQRDDGCARESTVAACARTRCECHHVNRGLRFQNQLDVRHRFRRSRAGPSNTNDLLGAGTPDWVEACRREWSCSRPRDHASVKANAKLGRRVSQAVIESRGERSRLSHRRRPCACCWGRYRCSRPSEGSRSRTFGVVIGLDGTAQSGLAAQRSQRTGDSRDDDHRGAACSTQAIGDARTRSARASRDRRRVGDAAHRG